MGKYREVGLSPPHHATRKRKSGLASFSSSFFGPAHEPSSPAAVTALGGGILPPYRSSSERPPSQPWGLSGEKRNINEGGGGMNVSYASIPPSLFRDKGRDKTGEEKVNEQQARICQLAGKVTFWYNRCPVSPYTYGDLT